MRKMISLFLSLLLLLSQSVTAFAIEEEKQADVYARAVRTTLGVYLADIDDGTAEVTTEDDITIIVTDIPEGAVRLMVVPVPKTEREAWVWITACLKDAGTPIHTFDIYFKDADGNRISANGEKVTIDCPHCSGIPKVCSLTTSGAVRVLNDSAQGATVTFTTDGSTYYVIADKAPSDHPGDSDIPQTGDNSHLAFWSGILVLSLIALFFLVFWKRRKKMKHKQ
ncbi:MAG: LPXTG cell wall anchor domain-containing protein [Clostridia bacterium]|nr:LPXTG cell wall anchor domain-containing protein [Clostridia bacterium]